MTSSSRPPLLLEHQLPTLAAAERAGALDETLRALRRFGLDDFGLLLWSLPDARYPNLSTLLPRMAPEEVQVRWAGQSGLRLLAQSLSFVRLADSMAVRHTGCSLSGRRILDFGCGFGRLMRLLYYYTDPENLVGVDASERSLEVCRADGVLGTLARCDDAPTELAASGLAVALSYSALAHLSEEAALAVLAAVRRTLSPGGLFVFGIRPIDFWRYLDGATGSEIADEMESRHRSAGFAFHPTNSATVGVASIALRYLAALREWELLACERPLENPYHLVVALRAR